MQTKERSQQRKRNHGGHRHSSSKVTQEDIQNQGNQQRPFKQISENSTQGALY